MLTVEEDVLWKRVNSVEWNLGFGRDDLPGEVM